RVVRLYLFRIRTQSWVHGQALGRHASLHACNVVTHVMITKGLFPSWIELGPRMSFFAHSSISAAHLGDLGVDELLLSLCNHCVIFRIAISGNMTSCR